jgi:hypothetical protein
MRTPHPRTAYRAGLGLALLAILMLVWLALGVGIIGGDGDPVNRVYVTVLAIGLVGAVLARFRPRGMGRTVLAMAAAQLAIAVIASIAGWGLPYSGPVEILAINAFFVAMFVVSALLFQRAARTQLERGVAAP